MNTNALTYAAGAILLGVVGVCFQDFAMQWQPVPAGIGMRTQLAYVAGALLAIGGALLLVPLLAWKNELGAVRRHWRPILLLGFVNSVIPTVCFSYAALSITAGPWGSLVLCFIQLKAKKRCPEWSTVHACPHPVGSPQSTA